MVDLAYSVDRTAGIALVGVVIQNDRSTRQHIALHTAVEGPLWVPLVNGVPVPEWTDGVWTDQLEAGERRGLGFATPGALGEPPIEIGTAERAREPPAVTLRHVLAGRVPK